jgi:hypothetical protein
MEPDLVREVHGRPASRVVDAKYKQDQPFADLCQVLAYFTALRLRRGHLVYAWGNADPVRHVVQLPRRGMKHPHRAGRQLTAPCVRRCPRLSMFASR